MSSPIIKWCATKEELKKIVRNNYLQVSTAKKAWVDAGMNVDDFVIPQELRILILYDDCGNDKRFLDFLDSRLLKDLCSGRHSNLLRS